jgi:hypothetical protein
MARTKSQKQSRTRVKKLLDASYSPRAIAAWRRKHKQEMKKLRMMIVEQRKMRARLKTIMKQFEEYNEKHRKR